MIEVIPSPDHVAAFHVFGSFEADDYDLAIPTIEAKLRSYNDISVLADLTDMKSITPDAAQRDIQYGLSRLGDLRRFKRAAVIADSQWLRSATALTDKLFPLIDARVFADDEREEALAWTTAIH